MLFSSSCATASSPKMDPLFYLCKHQDMFILLQFKEASLSPLSLFKQSVWQNDICDEKLKSLKIVQGAWLGFLNSLSNTLYIKRLTGSGMGNIQRKILWNYEATGACPPCTEHFLKLDKRVQNLCVCQWKRWYLRRQQQHCQFFSCFFTVPGKRDQTGHDHYNVL